MIYVAAYLGLRWSEVAGLRVENIDFFGHRLTVSGTVAEVEGKLIEAESDVKTDSSKRMFKVPSFLIEMLARHLARLERKDPGEYVFQAPLGGPVRYTNFRQRVFNPARKAAGLTGVTFHSLRHSTGGLLRQLGVHTQVIQQRLGHSSSRTTTDIYGWVPDETDEHAAKALDELFRSSRGLDAACEAVGDETA